MNRKGLILLGTLLLGVGLDQLTKYLVDTRFPVGTVKPVLPGFFNLVHVRNRGAAFGLLSTLSPEVAWLFFVLSTLAVLAVVGYLWYRLPKDSRGAALGYSFILAGALGNFLDRLRLGEVVDFLDFYLGRYHWPAFNVADSLICLGAGLLIWVIFTEEQGEHASHPH
ncbi:MAG: signal peptidase II [Syntrophobacterales bacterium]|nr:signal peptidase II [Syntrophobacterales bacterium]